MADDSSHSGRNAISARAGDPLRQHSEEEMGSQLGIHGVLCICGGFDLLGDMGLQDVVRGEADSALGQSGNGLGIQDHASASSVAGNTDGRRTDGSSFLSHGYHDLLPVRFRCHHAHPLGWLPSGSYELHCLDALRPLVAHFLLQYRCFQLVGWWLPFPVGLHRLLWWLCHPSLLRHCWFHFRLLGGCTRTTSCSCSSLQQQQIGTVALILFSRFASSSSSSSSAADFGFCAFFFPWIACTSMVLMMFFHRALDRTHNLFFKLSIIIIFFFFFFRSLLGGCFFFFSLLLDCMHFHGSDDGFSQSFGSDPRVLFSD